MTQLLTFKAGRDGVESTITFCTNLSLPLCAWVFRSYQDMTSHEVPMELISVSSITDMLSSDWGAFGCGDAIENMFRKKLVSDFRRLPDQAMDKFKEKATTSADRGFVREVRDFLVSVGRY